MFSVLTVYVLFALATALAGLAGGWWLRSRGMEPQEAAVDKEEVRRAQELLGCLQKLASGVAVELGEHNTRVEEINVELQSDKLHEPAKILNVVTKLVDVNKTMQGRLDQAEDRLREQVRLVESHAAEARTDALTLVGNRRAFETDIARCLADFHRAGQVFSLAMIDLDKFKRLNDTYGHQAGDEVLRGTGRVLRRVLRESDSIARYGGEEFAVIFNRATITEVQRALTRLRKAIAGAPSNFPAESSKSRSASAPPRSWPRKTWRPSSSGPMPPCTRPRKRAAIAVTGTMGRRSYPSSTWKPSPCRSHRPRWSKYAHRLLPCGDRRGSRPRDSTVEKLADDLPALLNRTAFCQHVRSRVAEWKRGGATMSLVLVEIDRFESLTQLHGPKFRDLLVTSLARVVFAGVRDMDMVSRYGTSCLAFLLPRPNFLTPSAWPIEFATRPARSCSRRAKRKQDSRSASA